MYDDYDDYKEARSNGGLVVFGSVRFIPLSEILRNDYDTSACPVTNYVFNPTKRLDLKKLETIIKELEKSIISYSKPNRDELLEKIISLKKNSLLWKNNFFQWSQNIKEIFNELCEDLEIKFPFTDKIIKYSDMQEAWTYEKNMAFWKGVIETKRPLVLCSPYNQYGNDKSKTTIHELLWLNDNGYIFEPIITDDQNDDYIAKIKIIAIPPTESLLSKIIILDYLHDSQDIVLESFNRKILAPLTEKIYTSNTELKLSETYEKYQVMYNDFVDKFNGYFVRIFPEHHEDLKMAISPIEAILELGKNKEEGKIFTVISPGLDQKLKEGTDVFSLSKEQTEQNQLISHRRINDEATFSTITEHSNSGKPFNKSPKP